MKEDQLPDISIKGETAAEQSRRALAAIDARCKELAASALESPSAPALEVPPQDTDEATQAGES